MGAMVACYSASLLFLWDPCCQSPLRSPATMQAKLQWNSSVIAMGALLSEPVAFTDGNATHAASQFAMAACYHASLLFLWDPCCQSPLRSPTSMRPMQPACLR